MKRLINWVRSLFSNKADQENKELLEAIYAYRILVNLYADNLNHIFMRMEEEEQQVKYERPTWTPPSFEYYSTSTEPMLNDEHLDTYPRLQYLTTEYLMDRLNLCILEDTEEGYLQAAEIKDELRRRRNTSTS